MKHGKIYDNITELIGNTPLVRVNRIKTGGAATVQGMLRNRLYLGELHFGALVNLHACEPIVDELTFRRVQQIELPRGPRPKNGRLLARLGVLRCSSCNARLVISTRTASRGRREVSYRCPVTCDCERRVTISADLAERTIVAAVQELLDGTKGSARSNSRKVIKQAEADVEQIDADMDKFVNAFDGFDVAAVRKRMSELQSERERRLDRLAELKASAPADVTVTARDWDKLTLDEQRGLVKAVIARAVVAPGKGPERITIEARV